MHTRLVSSIFGSGQTNRFFPKNILTLWQSLEALYRQRRELQSLDERMLLDIGVTKTEAETEAARHLWDVPAYWR